VFYHIFIDINTIRVKTGCAVFGPPCTFLTHSGQRSIFAPPYRLAVLITISL